jgi:hypothetical protein
MLETQYDLHPVEVLPIAWTTDFRAGPAYGEKRSGRRHA